MSSTERRLEREMREMREEMKEWKVKLQIERGKREAAERKMTDLEGDVEILKEKIKEERREREKINRIIGEIREISKRAESRQRREKEKQGREEEKKIKSVIGLVSASKRKRAEEDRPKVHERGIVIHKGARWNEAEDLNDWLEVFLVGTEWEIEETYNKETKKIIFKEVKDMEEIWKERERVNGEGEIRMEQWMNWEERKAKREAMAERDRRIEEAKRERKAYSGENFKITVDGKVFEWREKEGRIKKIEERECKEREEEREARRKKEEQDLITF